jgi:hypothetical protein
LTDRATQKVRFETEQSALEAAFDGGPSPQTAD